ncbi:hypothetical protein [Cellulosimicrobium cellulans]|uniref:hypothetical protein n=1 Tax=Cellulosimicrobium cellulans TaxID=1710 RepID=UPI00130EC906|nr:hypothetical protein [Cellulosimicrobium cellulans]
MTTYLLVAACIVLGAAVGIVAFAPVARLVPAVRWSLRAGAALGVVAIALSSRPWLLVAYVGGMAAGVALFAARRGAIPGDRETTPAPPRPSPPRVTP